MISKIELIFNLSNKRALIIIIALFIIMSNLMSSDSIYRIPSRLTNIESKCLWVNNDDLLDSLSIDSIFLFAEYNNINCLYLKVRDNGESYYNSNIVYKNDSIQYNLDPLQYAINKVVKDSLDIKINAWLDIYKLWDFNYYPTKLTENDNFTDNAYNNSSHFYYQCPECLDADETGRPDSRIQLNTLQSRNWGGIYLAPTHPEVNPYIISIIKEIILNYQLINGIYLDHMHYQDFYSGYNEKGIDNFEALYDFTPIDFYRGIISIEYGYSENKIKEYKELWNSYRINKISELVESLSSYINSNFLDIQLSVGINGNLYDSRNRWLIDWKKWLNNNYIDQLVIKENSRNLVDFIYNTRTIENEFTRDKLNNIIYNFSITQSQIDMVDKIFFMRLNDYGHMGFEYDIDKHKTDWYIPILNTLDFRVK